MKTDEQKAKAAARTRAYYQRNKEKVKAYVASWQKENRGRHNENARAKTKRERSAFLETLPKNDSRILFSQGLKKCSRCLEIKDRSQFSPTNKGKWVMHMCRPCRNAHIAETPKLSISRRVSVSVRHSLNGKKAYRTEKLLGYSMLELRRHLERQFVKGMSWDNMKQWHIDHIVPLASFNFQDATSCEFKQAWSLSNLRPLWAKENLSKNARRDFLL